MNEDIHDNPVAETTPQYSDTPESEGENDRNNQTPRVPRGERFDRNKRNDHGDRPRRFDRKNRSDADDTDPENRQRTRFERRNRGEIDENDENATENRQRTRFERRNRGEIAENDENTTENRQRTRFERRNRGEITENDENMAENRQRSRFERRNRGENAENDENTADNQPQMGFDRNNRNENANESVNEIAAKPQFERKNRNEGDLNAPHEYGERPRFERRDPEKYERQDNRNRTPARFATRPPLGRKPQQPVDEHANQKKGRQPFDGKDHLYEVIKVRLARSQRLIEVNTNEKNFAPNTRVLVRIHRNVLLATTIGYRYRRIAEINTLPYILREANDEDVRIDNENVAIEKRAQELATAFAIENALQMKVLSADLSHDHKNITINFASDVRVDFREMVAYLAGQLKLRVEMYQLGLRNGTGLICALGSCGQRLCCGRFLGQFDPVAVKLLRAQGLATNPKRISGVCGRLYCCLSYEYCDYLKERRSLPKKGKRVLTRWGLGRITDTDPLREEVVIAYDNGEIQRLSMHDYVFVTDDIISKVENEEIVFPLEPARFYLNHDQSNAVEMPMHTKAPMPAPSKARSRHAVTSTIAKKSTLERHKLTTTDAPTPTPNAAPKSAAPTVVHAEKPTARTLKRHRGKLPPEFTTNSAGIIVKRVNDASATAEVACTVRPNNTEERAVRHTAPVTSATTAAPTEVETNHDAPQNAVETETTEREVLVMTPPPFQQPPHPLPKDVAHPSNPRRRHLRARPPITPGN